MTEPNTFQMTSLRFIQLLESYGAQVNHWPQGERGSAMAFAEKFEDAQVLISEAHALDTVLNNHTAPAPSDLLRARILKRALAETSAPQTGRVSGPKILPLRAIAATLLVGVFVGLGSGFFNAPSTEDPQALYAEQSYDWLDEVFTSELLDEGTP